MLRDNGYEIIGAATAIDAAYADVDADGAAPPLSFLRFAIRFTLTDDAQFADERCCRHNIFITADTIEPPPPSRR